MRSEGKYMSKKIVFRIIAGVVAIVLIGMVLFVTNVFVGNPISKTFAKEKAIIYISENYNQLNLEIENIGYNFKDGNYMVLVQSNTSKDTHFSLYYRNGKIHSTTYDIDVLSGQNTYRRLAEEYKTHLTPILERAIGEDFRAVSLYPQKDTMFTTNKLPLDVAFDKSLIQDGELSLSCNYKKADSKYFADILVKADSALSAEDYAFKTFSLQGENQGIMVQISGITAEQIKSGNLDQLIEQAKSTGESNGIRVFIKGDK